MNCPGCGSSNIDRIGLFEYQCDDCGDVFDVTEGIGKDDDPYNYGDVDDFQM